VFLDAIPISFVGVSFGVVSSAITALHSVVIKKALDVVKGSTLELSWYSNLLSAVILLPLIVVMGELPEVMKLFFEPEAAVIAPNPGIGHLRTFMWGTLITASP
jgi:GDP-fucose transporter C1